MAGSIQGIGQGIGAGGLGRAGGVLGAQQGDRAGFRIPLGREGGSSFADTLKEALNRTSELQEEAQDAIGAYLRGEPVEVHEVMAAAEEAGIALEMLVEFRNKITEAYRTVVSMQS